MIFEQEEFVAGFFKLRSIVPDRRAGFRQR